MRKRNQNWKKIVVMVLTAVMLAGTLVGSLGTTTVYAAEASAIPESYSSVEQGYTPAARNQGSFGNCWIYAATACVEISMVKNKVMTAEEVDLSENHLIYIGWKINSLNIPA